MAGGLPRAALLRALQRRGVEVVQAAAARGAEAAPADGLLHLVVKDLLRHPDVQRVVLVVLVDLRRHPAR